MIRVKVVFIGSLADMVGVHTEVIEIPSNTITVKDFINYLQRLKPSASKFLEGNLPIQVFVNDVEATHHRVLRDGDRVTLMPPLYEGG